MTGSYDDVSNIHRRYSFTLLTPSSYRQSLVISIIVVLIMSAVVVAVYLDNVGELFFRLPAVIAVLMVTQYVDSRFIRNKEYSKAIHMSFFGNALWLGIILCGIAASAVLSKETLSLFYVTQGMFIFASFRIGLLTTTLGLSLRQAWLLCFVQPVSMFLVLIPTNMWGEALGIASLASGAVFLIASSVWSVMTDRAGRPGIESTHKLVQGYLASRSTDFHEVESILTSRATPSTVTTTQIKLYTKNNDFRMILPEIHPGPYHPIGGSNVTYGIYKTMNSSAMVMHSISDHALNLPSKEEVEKYLADLPMAVAVSQGSMCTEPVTIQVNKARVVGMLFEKTAVLFLSLSPHGMEDVPNHIKKEIEQFASNRHFEKLFVVDCHNAMGKEISEPDSQDLLKAAKTALETLVTKQNSAIEFGYANSDDMRLSAMDLGPGGLGVLCLKINNETYFLGWADANNMENGLREKIVDEFAKNDMKLLEVCTSDTHYSAKIVRTKEGYYHFGKVTSAQQISDWFVKIAKQAEKRLEPASFEILEKKSNIKVMGTAVFGDFSKALDRCINMSKIFMGGCVAFFIGTLFL
jgi:putative membrane protein